MNVRQPCRAAAIGIIVCVGWVSLAQSQDMPLSPEAIAIADVNSISCGVTHYSALAELGRLPPRQPVYPYPIPGAPDAAVTSTVDETNGTDQDVEPAVSRIAVNGINPATVTVYIKLATVAGKSTSRLYYTRTTDDVTFTGGPLALPSGYLLMGDPYMAQNPHTGGLGPDQLSLVGQVNNAYQYLANGIYLWRSTDGGATWLPPVQVTSDTGANYYYDKPNVTVSQYAGTLGTIYVIYTRTDRGHCLNNFCGGQIVSRRSDDGGATFTAEVALTTISNSTSVGGPQIVAATTAARVYGVWADYPAGAIQLSYSDDKGVTWTAAPGNPTGRSLMGPVSGGSQTLYNRYPMYPANQTAMVVAYTLPAARFNSVAGKVGIVWHERASDGIHTDVYYAAKTAGGWQGPIRVNQISPKDQFNPALDVDASGNLLVTYYSTANDPYFNDLYQSYFTRIDSSGSILQSDTNIASFFSDPSTLAVVQYFLGDYQDVWFDGAKWRSVWVGVPSSSHADIYLSKIQ